MGRISAVGSMPSRCILIVLDGLGDHLQPRLGGTPLQAARTPVLDRIARCGATGLFHAMRPGVALSSPDAHMAMFGYRLAEMPSRSVLEALAAGVPVNDDHVLVLARLASGAARDRVLEVRVREPDVHPDELAKLIAEVAEYESGGIRFRLHRISGTRQLITIEGAASPNITDTDTHREHVPLAEPRPLAVAADDPEAIATARALKAYLVWAYRTLSTSEVNQTRLARGDIPINLVLTYFPGRVKSVEPFSTRWGLRALSISSKMVQWGLAATLGIDSVRTPHVGDPEAEIAAKLEAALDHMPSYDFIHVHTMAPDDAAHLKDPSAKVAAIEALDRGLGRCIDRLLDAPELLLVVTSDHSTPSSGSMIHSGEPVPIAFAGQGVRKDDVTRFDEVACGTGSLGLVRGRELMLLILSALDRSLMRGLVHTPRPRAYWKDDYEPFSLPE